MVNIGLWARALLANYYFHDFDHHDNDDDVADNEEKDNADNDAIHLFWCD